MIKNGSRKRHLVQYKVSYAEAALNQKYTYKSIGENINVSAAAISKMLDNVD